MENLKNKKIKDRWKFIQRLCSLRQERVCRKEKLKFFPTDRRSFLTIANFVMDRREEFENYSHSLNKLLLFLIFIHKVVNYKHFVDVSHKLRELRGCHCVFVPDDVGCTYTDVFPCTFGIPGFRDEHRNG